MANHDYMRSYHESHQRKKDVDDYMKRTDGNRLVEVTPEMETRINRAFCFCPFCGGELAWDKGGLGSSCENCQSTFSVEMVQPPNPTNYPMDNPFMVAIVPNEIDCEHLE